MARQRLGSEPLVALHELVVRPLAKPSTRGAFYRGMRKVAIDGTVLDVPDCELYAMSLGHLVVRAFMLEAATEANIDVDRLSFKGSFQILKTRLPECNPSDEVKFSEWYAAVVWEISRERIPPRANRINPRVIKRKMSRWNKCRPEHRKQLPLTQSFEQAVVMLH